MSVQGGHLDWRVLARLLLRRSLGALPSLSGAGERGLLSSIGGSLFAEVGEGVVGGGVAHQCAGDVGDSGDAGTCPLYTSYAADE